jgi:hypothetical protein
MNFEELIQEVEQLTVSDKWQLVKRVLGSLENQQEDKSVKTDWHQFLRETYGLLRDTPIQRWDQGDYEEREPLE